VVQVKSATTAHGADELPQQPKYQGRGQPPKAQYPTCARRLSQIATCAPADKWVQRVYRRRGDDTPLTSRFLVLAVRPASRRIAKGPDRELPERLLICEWPDGAQTPERYWLSNLPADTDPDHLAYLAKGRWRIEQDYRELKHGLGLDHFEGRSWRGWHHHVTLASIAHAFLTTERQNPKVPAPA